MLTPLPVKHVTIFLVQDDVPALALALAESEAFSPRSDMEHAELPERPGERYQQLYRSAEQRLEKILGHLRVALDPLRPGDAHPTISEEALAQTDAALGAIWRECSTCELTQQRLQEESRIVEQLNDALSKFEALNVDFDLLQGGLRFLDVRIGAVARSDLKRLREAVGLIGYSQTVFKEGEGVAHVALAGLTGAEAELKSVLEAASFRPLELPAEFRDTPHQLRRQLDQRRNAIEQGWQDLREQIEDGRRRFGATLQQAAHALQLAAPLAHLVDGLESRGGLARISGWVPAARLGEVRTRVAERLGDRFMVESRDPLPDERHRVPSVLRYPRLLRPFATLVRSYGIPRYGELDPTWLFAFTFVAMFGMMFGDIGQGALIAIGGALLPRRLATFRPFVVAAGLSSTLFGFVYGSLFGYEEVIHPLWMSPLSDPMRMLSVAFLWGVAFILLTTAMTVRNRLVEGRVREALLDGRGLAGVGLYLGVLYAGWRWLEAGVFGPVEKAAVVVPLGLILGERWLHTQAPVAERFLVVVLEGFETFMSYIANTLSFLRVAAFSLNHVALAIAVFTMADMMGTTGHWITVILGNAFILVLEGAIVTIQVLRLEYYEGFSRFFAGDGQEFRPLTMAPPLRARGG